MKLSEHKNSGMQGNAGIGAAIAYFTKYGYSVSVPLTDTQKYDLVVDLNNTLYRVQVKTTTYSQRGIPIVNIRTLGGNRSGTGRIKKFDPSQADYLFILTEHGTCYLIPSTEVCGSSVNLGDKYEKFRLSE